MMMESWRLMSLTKILLIIFYLNTSSLISQNCISRLIVTSDFNSVNIFINDSLVSTDGNFSGELENGIYILIADELSDRWNSKTYVDTIIIEDCRTIELNYKFRNSHNYNSNLDIFNNHSNNLDALQLDLTNFSKKEKFIDTPLFKILSASAIILGGITAYYKIKADKHFDEYLKSRDKDKLDKTKKYDLISGITLATFQINFGYVLLRFLLE
jgi:hypothetical protein